jgi:glyoxylase-like metal-dependent hydrolase (beta-lactamase superfamily II)
MKIISHAGGIASTNCYLLIDEAAGRAVLVDAPDHTVGPVIEYVKRHSITLESLWLTHGHFDHLADHRPVRDAFAHCTLLAHALDGPKLLEPVPAFFKLPFEIPPARADAFIEDGQTLVCGDIRARVMHTPGHSPGHVALYIEDQGVLIGGDLIIDGSIGRTDFPDCDPAAMDRSIARVMDLPGETALLPGHGAASTLAHERAENAQVRRALRGVRGR